MARPGNSLVAAIRGQHADPQQLNAPCRPHLAVQQVPAASVFPADFSVSLSYLRLTSLQR